MGEEFGGDLELGVWGQSPQPPEAKESGSEARFLQFFNKNNAFICIFRPK